MEITVLKKINKAALDCRHLTQCVTRSSDTLIEVAVVYLTILKFKIGSTIILKRLGNH